jgi:hypothetical protein
VKTQDKNSEMSKENKNHQDETNANSYKDDDKYGRDACSNDNYGKFL